MTAAVEEKKRSKSKGNRRVLVLNRNWEPINITPLERALKMAASTYECGTPKARIIDCDETFQAMEWSDWAALQPREGEDNLSYHGGEVIVRVPEVIVLSKYGGMPVKKARFSRHELYKRDNYQCQYCSCKVGRHEVTIDHVQPRSRGGLTTWENCVLACYKCNSRKADRTPEEAGMKLLRKPIRPTTALAAGDYRCESWKQFLSAVYWLGELENDIKD